MNLFSRVFQIICFLHLNQIYINNVYSIIPKNRNLSYLLINSTFNNRNCKVNNNLSNTHLNNNSINGINKKSLLTINPGNLNVEGCNDSTVLYFTNLLKNKFKKHRFDFSNYLDHCKNVKDQIFDNYYTSLMEHISNKFPNKSLLLNKANTELDLTKRLNAQQLKDGSLMEERSDSTKVGEKQKVFDLVSEVNILGKLYESSIFGSVLSYLQMTSKDNKLSFMSGLTSDDKKNRLNILFDVLNYVESEVYSLFKNNLNNLKILYINEFFNYVKSNKKEYDINKEYSRILSSYKTNLNNLIPIYFKTNVLNNSKDGLLGNNLRNMFNQLIKMKIMDNSDLVLAEQILKQRANISKNWNVNGEVNEFKLVLDNINLLVAAISSENDKKTKNTDNLMDVISSQQHKIKEYNKLLQNEKGSCNLAFTYRIPGTNLTISSSLFGGKNNIQLACIPDNYAHFLGPDGFVKSLPCGFLGMDLNISF